MNELEFSDNQKLIISGLYQAIQQEFLHVIPAEESETGKTRAILTILDDDDGTFIPIGIIFDYGEEVFEKYKFGFDFLDDEHNNIIFNKPSIWQRLKQLFLKRKK